jgi:hypothetical protein
VDTAPVQTDADKFLFAIPEPESVNHFVVFLLGTVPLEPGYGAAVYVAWPTPELAWNLAGHRSLLKGDGLMRRQDFYPTRSPVPSSGWGAARLPSPKLVSLLPTRR